ncbi:hypothetical protein CBS101457_003864 [Exobasidium rhododendri]|nr:hypothetical protein CBS101457_003864 [Exobasidium rhododendri]
MEASSRHSPQLDKNERVPAATGGASGLYRAPTWARNINFDSSFDINTSGLPNFSSNAASSEGLTGVALGAPPSSSEVTRGSWPKTDSNQSRSGTPQSFNGPHARVMSNSPGTPSKNSPTLTQSEKSTPRAMKQGVMSAMLPSHQRVASASSGSGSLDWSRPTMTPQPHSSADLYAMPVESRPSTAMSMSTASMEESKDHRRDSATSSNVLTKRASVLSFQTALSGVGGFTSNEDLNQGNRSNQAMASSSEVEDLNDTLPLRPWLTRPMDPNPSGTSSFSSSPDDQILPGGWGKSRSWNQGYEDALPNPNSPAMTRKTLRSPSQSPQMRYAALEEMHPSSQASYSRTPSGGPTTTSPKSLASPVHPAAVSPLQEQRPYRPSSMLRNETTQDIRVHPQSSLPISPVSGHSTVHVPFVEDAFGQSSADMSSTVDASERTIGRDRSSTIVNNSAPQYSQPMRSAEQTKPNSSRGTGVEAVSRPPAVPDKSSPPIVPSKNEVGLSSPPLSDIVIPPHLPSNTAGDAASFPLQMPADRSPVSDFRKKPLARMSTEESTLLESQEANRIERVEQSAMQRREAQEYSAMPAPISQQKVGPGVGAHAARNSGIEQVVAPAFAALMRKPSNGAPRAVLATAPAFDATDRSPSPSIETPPREPSPPPEGEVEARAEWERAQIKQLTERAKKASSTPRKTTFRGQLKPLQLVVAGESKRTGRESPKKESPTQTKNATMMDSSFDENQMAGATDSAGQSSTSPMQNFDGRIASLSATPASSPILNPAFANKGGGGGLSTQQLQRQLARDQRRSVSAVNMAMGPMGVSDIGGAYPVFSSPSTSATNVVGGANRQYSGLMPQRSLVPPFELQNRPDGLPSALLGADGVRRSPNDPEICLECMMRDEDMIDVHVLGANLWERESDRGFEEAIRLEGEEDARRERAAYEAGNTASLARNGDTLEGASNVVEGGETSLPKEVSPITPSSTRLTKMRVKRVARGEPLTVERLKLHTQMNPPASSHRWRTLQVFLSVQAKYIAMEQKARGGGPVVPPKSGSEYDHRLLRTQIVDSKATQRNRATSVGLYSLSETTVPNNEAAQSGKAMNEAKEVKKGNKQLSVPSMNDYANEVEEQLQSAPGPPPATDNNSEHNSIPRRSTAGPNANTFARAGSAQDLRMIPNATTSSASQLQQRNPALSIGTLAPPKAPFRGPSSPTTPGSLRMRTVSSQMSLAGSGSMIDMHVGLEDRKEHRIAQAGFVPGTPLHSQSPSALNRAYYGFPGDSEVERERVESWNQGGPFDQSMTSSFAEVDDTTAATSRISPDLDRKKKKSSGGLRGFFSKISGKDAMPTEAETSRSSRQQSEEFDDSRNRSSSFGLDSALDLQPPPSMGGLLSRARRSTSSLLGSPSGRQSMDSTRMLGEHSFNNPMMASQTSLELGPFGSGPLPPPRKDSRFSRAESPRAPSPEKEKTPSRLRTFSSGNLMSKRKTSSAVPTIPASGTRTSSMLQQQAPPMNNRATSNSSLLMREKARAEEEKRVDRNGSSSRLSSRKDLPNAPVDGSRFNHQSQDGAYLNVQVPSRALPFDTTDADYQRQSLAPSSQGPLSTPPPPPQLQQQQQQRSPMLERFNQGNTSYSNEAEGRPSMSGDGAPRRPVRSALREIPGGSPSEQSYRTMNEAKQQTTSPQQAFYHPPFLQVQQKEQYYRSSDQLQQRVGGGGGGGGRREGDGDLSSQAFPGRSEFDQFVGGNQSNMNSPSPPLPSPSSASNPSRKSRLLKLPFGRNKRESVATVKSISNSNYEKGQTATSTTTPSLKSRSSKGAFDDVPRYSYSSNNGNNNYNNNGGTNTSFQPSMESMRASQTVWNGDRQRLNSNNLSAYEERGLPPRSQSAMGVLDGNSTAVAAASSPSYSNGSAGGIRGLIPRLRSNSRAALREVDED